MKIKDKLITISEAIDEKSLQQFGFHIKDVSLGKIIDYMYNGRDSSSLAVTRILFGLAMVFDIPDERGGATMDKRWANSEMCHFPLIPWIQALPMPFMGIVYAALWIGAFGIMLGYKYRVTGSMFTVCYWYLFLIEKSYWNNHSYLFGLIALLLSCTEANCYWSLDVYFNNTQEKTTVPYWNYFILKYQFFILYFMAGMKKATTEWLTGYSVQNISEHWVFDPFKLFLTVAQINYLIVHWFICIFDLTIAMWMSWSRTRHVAMLFCALFHLMNSRLFTIGMFPWVCLATMPLFYPFDWPQMIINHFVVYYRNISYFICEMYHNVHKCAVIKDNNTINEEIEKVNKDYTEEVVEQKDMDVSINNRERKDNDDLQNVCNKKPDTNDSNVKNDSKYKKVTVFLILFYVFIQAFLPYSHFLTKGYNNWTNGLYGYSWDMMVHTWDVQTAVVKIVDNDNHKREFFIDPYLYSPNDRWTRHSDMVHQYAKCLKSNLLAENEERKYSRKNHISENISIYVDVWCSMNGRFVQRVFDPHVDLLKAHWSPFRLSPYLMPLLDEALSWRSALDAIRKDVHAWSNYSDVVFFADFPGYFQERYIPSELYNVTVTVLDGQIGYEPEISNYNNRQSLKLTTGHHIKIDSGLFHKILNIGRNPAFYMYAFKNSTEINNVYSPKPKLPIFNELYRRLAGMILFVNLMMNYAFRIIFYFCGCQ